MPGHFGKALLEMNACCNCSSRPLFSSVCLWFLPINAFSAFLAALHFDVLPALFRCQESPFG